MSDLPRIAYSRKEAAAAVGVSTDVIDKAIMAGDLPAKRTASTGLRGRPAGRILIPVAGLHEWFEGLADA